jgi:ureidoglycolate lyase
MEPAPARLRPEPLTRQAFAAFGDVVEMRQGMGHAINGGTSWRWDDAAMLDLTGAGGRPMLSLFRTQPATLPMPITLLERHPLSSQTFLPLSAHPFLVVVAPAGDVVREQDIKAFRTAPGQGVNYAAGVWHHPLIALDQVSDFAVVGRAAGDENCDFFEFSHPILLAA